MRALGMAQGLAALGHDLTLVTASRQATLLARVQNDHNVTVIECPDVIPSRWRHGGFGVWDTLSRLRLISTHKYHIVHGFEHRPSVIVPAAVLQGRGIPFVSDWSDLWGVDGIFETRSRLGKFTVGTYDRVMEDRTHQRATALTVVSTTLRDRALNTGFPGEMVLRVVPGVNPDLVAPIPKAKARRSFGLEDDVPILGTMGISDYDDDLVGDVFAALSKCHPRVLLLTVGPRKPKLQSVLSQAGLADRVRPLGLLPLGRLGEALSCADVLLLPFRDRPINRPRFPNRFGEYLASGRPIVTNDTADLGYVVKQEGVGVAVPDRADMMADAVSELLDDPHQAAIMGARGRKLAEGEFSWNGLAKDIEALYMRAIAR
jgi:glycosyltransferase involved in cell wall biosynthesis